MKDVLAVLLAGGAGERLHPLTRNRAKPAVPFGGIYRIVDFTLSNCLNSQCRRIQILVQYKSLSLTRHVREGWNIMHTELGEFLEAIPPQQRVSKNWYLGTADAIYQNLYSLEQTDSKLVLVLAAYHIYRMNYQKLVEFHRRMDADVTVATIEVPAEDAHRFGVVATDSEGHILGFEEKPATPTLAPGESDTVLASMGIYMFDREVLKEACIEDAQRTASSHDFGRDVIPSLVGRRRVFAYRFRSDGDGHAAYWRDVGTLDAYWEANMELVEENPPFKLDDRGWPVRTRVLMAPPAKFVFARDCNRHGVAVDSIVSPGCVISGGMVKRSVLSPEVHVASYARVEESILFNGVTVGRHARVRRAVIEKNVQVPDYAEIGHDLTEDAKRFRVTRGGIVVIERFDEIPVARY